MNKGNLLFSMFRVIDEFSQYNIKYIALFIV